MHVAASHPATWRGRTLTSRLTELRVRERAVTLYRLIAPLDAMPRLRAFGARILARFHKARSATQTPSAYERLTEELVVLHLAGVEPTTLRRVSDDLRQLLWELDAGQPVDEARVLAAIEEAQRAARREAALDLRLCARPDRELRLHDIEAAIDATQADSAANDVKLQLLGALRADMRRRGLAVIRGGRA